MPLQARFAFARIRGAGSWAPLLCRTTPVTPARRPGLPSHHYEDRAAESTAHSGGPSVGGSAHARTRPVVHDVGQRAARSSFRFAAAATAERAVATLSDAVGEEPECKPELDGSVAENAGRRHAGVPIRYDWSLAPATYARVLFAGCAMQATWRKIRAPAEASRVAKSKPASVECAARHGTRRASALFWGSVQMPCPTGPHV